jgi:hypothetical protein
MGSHVARRALLRAITENLLEEAWASIEAMGGGRPKRVDRLHSQDREGARSKV